MKVGSIARDCTPDTRRIADPNVRTSWDYIGSLESAPAPSAPWDASADVRLEPTETILDPRPPWGACDLHEGEVVSERYRVLARIGVGDASVVYRVVHQSLDKELALKVLRPELSTASELHARFEREARIASALDDIHLVRVTDFGRTASDLPYLVMELVEGTPFGEWRAAHGDAAIAQILDIFDQALAGLEQAHEKGIVHGDLRSEHIIVTSREGRIAVKILELGIGRMISEREFGGPEVDIASVGVLLREALAGLSPSAEQERAFAARVEAVAARTQPTETADPLRSASGLREALRGCLPAERTLVDAKNGKRSALPLLAPLAIALLLAGVLFTYQRTPARVDPAPNRKSTVTDVEAAMAERDLPKARAMMTALLVEKPDDARVNLIAGHLAFLEDDRNGAASSYGLAIGRDPAVSTDEIFASNARQILLGRGRGAKAANALAKSVAEEADARAAPLLAVAAEQAATPGTRRLAYRGLERLGETGRIDRVALLARDLERIPKIARECPTRKWYVERLAAIGDPRALPALEKQRHLPAKGWVFDEDSKANACMTRELDRAVQEVRSSRRQPTRSFR
jgi:tRNA A-37 threonylcarbamoyl transferase component Bud32